ncbi:mechanosensitive ion channel family protein [Gangjinia marincola]|uniref:Mechanosensitive ion channel family protein n=1 Tax=Gangjinia marincola TaxID=578463 RepID=A0ABN1MD31_9FLAO
MIMLQNLDVPSVTKKATDRIDSWIDAIVTNLPNFAIGLIFLIVSYFLSKWIYRGVLKLAKKKVDQVSIARLIARTASTIIVIAGIILALSVMNLSGTIKSLLAGAGISGLVIGLAMQGALANTISGIALSFRKRIRIGDWVETTGFAGEVLEINLSNFVLKEVDNNIVIIPNKTIIDNPLKNYALTTKMRVLLDCGVGYESDLEQVEKLSRQTIVDTFDHIDSPDDVEFYFTEFGGSSINFTIRYWIDSENALEKFRAKSKGIIELKKTFDRENINIPFPIRTLQFDNKLSLNGTMKQTEETENKQKQSN